MKAYDISQLFSDGKEFLAQSEWTKAAKTFFRIKNAAIEIGDQTAAAMATYWQTASEVLAEDFGSTQSFKDMLKAYRNWMEVDPDDRNEARLQGTVSFCRAWLYILGDRDAPSRDELTKLRNETEHGNTTIDVAAHLACEFALCQSEHKPHTLELTKEQFNRFVSCVRNRRSCARLPQRLKESYESLADRLNVGVSAGTQNGAQTGFQPRYPRADDDSVFTYISLKQCDRFYRSVIAALPATVTQKDGFLAFASIIFAWAMIVWLAILFMGVTDVVTLLAFVGPLLGIVVSGRWFVRRWRYVFIFGVVILFLVLAKLVHAATTHNIVN